MTSIALVLGAGGVAGRSYESGALAALDEATGWDARTADLIIGTSAGAGLAATLRLGLSPADHLARATGRALSDEGEALLGEFPEPVRLPDRPAFPPIGLPMAPWLAIPALLMPGPVRPLMALAGWCPRGAHDPSIVGARLREIEQRVSTAPWPERPTWICAVRLRDGRRVVFGRDDVETPDLATAVEASSAVPGFFRPVGVGGTSYVDGGIFSPSNADLAAGLGFDLVVVVSPMSTVPPDPPWSPRRWGRTLQAGLLRGELDAVTTRGTPVLDLSPEPAEAAGFDEDLLADEHSEAVARRARESVRRRLASPPMADLLAKLSEGRSGSTDLSGV